MTNYLVIAYDVQEQAASRYYVNAQDADAAKDIVCRAFPELTVVETLDAGQLQVEIKQLAVSDVTGRLKPARPRTAAQLLEDCGQSVDDDEFCKKCDCQISDCVVLHAD